MQIRKNGQTASIRTRKIINKFGPEFIAFDNKNRPGWLLVRSKKGWGWLVARKRNNFGELKMFQVGEVKKWAKQHGITVKKQGEGYVWFEDNQTPSSPEPLDNVVKSVFNKVTNNKYVEHQKNYKPEN